MINPKEPPKITFPHSGYPMKIIGIQSADFRSTVLKIIKKHDPSHNGQSELKLSRHGNYQSMSIKILATSHEQLDNLHKELKATGLVKVVL